MRVRVRKIDAELLAGSSSETEDNGIEEGEELPVKKNAHIKLSQTVQYKVMSEIINYKYEVNNIIYFIHFFIHFRLHHHREMREMRR